MGARDTGDPPDRTFLPIATTATPSLPGPCAAAADGSTGQGGSKLFGIHWSITKEKRVGEGGLNGRLRGLRKRRFLIRGRQEDVNFSGEGKEHKM